MAIAVFTSFEQLTTDGLAVLNGGSVTVQAAGTTTPLSVFSDTALSVAAANPIILDSAGRHSMRYISAVAYKTIVKDAAGVTIDTYDGIDPGIPIGSGILPIAQGGTSSGTAAGAITALGGATASEVADIAADVAALSGALASSEKTHIATGTTAQRPATPAEGDIRRNTTTTRWEGYVAAWQNFMTDNDLAAQSDQETATSVALAVTPGRQHFHPSAAKAWARFNSAGTVAASYNITSVTDTGTGDWTVVIATDFSTATYGALGFVGYRTATPLILNTDAATAAGTFDLRSNDVTNTARDPDTPDAIFWAAFGDQ